jgi:hypothetical protein
MNDLVKKVRVDAFANCAWLDAVTPDQAAGLRAEFGGGDPETYETVKARLGEEAANAWQDGCNARERFFASVSNGLS